MQPKIVNTSKSELCLVVVPDNARAWKNETYHVNTLWYKSEQMRLPKYIDLPHLPKEEVWQLIGPLKDITEEQALVIIDKIEGLGTFVYPDYQEGCDNGFETALESLDSLVASTGLKGNVIILKRTA